MSLTYAALGHRGRFANMLWQIASTVGVARLCDQRPVFDPTFPYRPFLSIPDEWFDESWRKAPDVCGMVRGNQWQTTYLQEPQRWAHVTDEISAAFSPSVRAQAVLDGIPSPSGDAVAVHVRRTDYVVRPDHLPMLDVGYYTRSAVTLEREPPHEFDYHVYGDDPEWATGMLPPRWEWKAHAAVAFGEVEDEPTDWLDLMLMARYRRLIIANSAYSWWAAFLAGPSATVCFPSRWFGPKIDVPSPALPEWIEVAA